MCVLSVPLSVLFLILVRSTFAHCTIYVLSRFRRYPSLSVCLARSPRLCQEWLSGCVYCQEISTIRPLCTANYIIQYIRKWALGSRGSGRLSTLASLAARALRVHVLRWVTILSRCRVSRCNTQHLLNCSGAWRLCRWDGQLYSGRLEITNYHSLVPTASLAGFASAPARMVRAKNAFGGVAMDLCMPVSHKIPRKQTCFRHTVTSGCVRAWPHL